MEMEGAMMASADGQRIKWSDTPSDSSAEIQIPPLIQAPLATRAGSSPVAGRGYGGSHVASAVKKIEQCPQTSEASDLPPSALAALGAAAATPAPPAAQQASDLPPSALAALGAAAATPAPPAAQQEEEKDATGPSGVTKTGTSITGAIIGRVGNLLVFVETEARSVYEPVKVWLVETSGKVRAAIEASAAPALQRLQVAGEPIVLYVKPIYAKAIQLKGSCTSRVLAIYGAAYDSADARYKSACALVAAKVTAVKGKGLELYKAAEGRALPYYVKAQGVVQPYYMKVKDGVQYVQTTVGGVVFKIKVAAGEQASLVTNAVLARYTAIAEFIGSYTGPIAAKLAAMYKAVETYVSGNLSAILAKARQGKAIAWTKACDVAVVVKVKSTAVRDRAMVYPNAVYVQVKGGFVYMKGVVDGRVVVVKACMANIANAVASTILKMRDQVKLQTCAAFDIAHVKYLSLQAKTKSLAADPNARVTAASAVGGATVMGAGGGAVGLLTGGAVGAACGVPLSLFTFGLSIPLGAALGGGAGLCAGAAAGGAAGLVGAGAAGRKIHQNKDSIAEGFSAAASRVSDIKGLAVDKASAYKSKVADSTAASAAYVRARFAGGTGGTGEDK